MTYIRKLILTLALSAGLAPAFAQVPPPVPALPDTERRTSYSISGTTCSCNVNFAIFGDGVDFANWIEVYLNGTRVSYNDATYGWTITSPSGSLSSLARPITDAKLTFTNAQTGTVQIVGARRPRRITQFQENTGVSARNLNQAFTDIVAQNREIWDKTNDMTGRGLFSQPGQTLGLLPLPASCVNGFLGFDATGLNPQCLASGAGSGNVIGPVSSTINDLAIWKDTIGHTIGDATGISATPGGPLTISPTASSSTRGLVVNQTGPASGTTTGDSSSNCWGASPSLVYNYICVDGEGANVIGAPPVFTYGLDVGLVTGGANSTGAKQAGLFYLYKASASNPATPRDHVALGATGLVQAGDGGTGTGIGNSKGTMFATSFQVIARSGATNLFEVSGGEVDCSINTGASASYRFCWNIVSGGQVAGAVIDAGLVFGAAGLPFNNGILFADANGIAPISATGCAICSSGSATIDSAIDFGSYTITSYLIRGPHSYLDGAGNGLFENTVVIGKTGTAPGVAQFKGSTSGMATITAQAVAGTPTLFLPTGAGTFAVSATSPLSLNATTGALSCSTCLTTASFANPTASIGLSAVNGSAVTAMRSDAAPALSQAIVPTWTGVHTHTPSQAANTSTDGIALADATASTAGNQQYSPRLRLTAQGWKTNATAASQQTDWIVENVPVQGAANPDSYLKFSSQINGGGYTELFSFRNQANSGTTTFYINNASQSQFQLAVGGTATGVHFVDSTQYIFGAITAIPVKVYTSNTERARFFDSGCFAVGTTTDCGSGAILANTSVKATTYIQTGTPTVAGLPACGAGTKGARDFVTDANATFTAGIGAVVVGGGANNVPVTCDGGAWRIGANDNIPSQLMRKFA